MIRRFEEAVRATIKNTMKSSNNNDGRFGIEKQCVEFARRWLYKNKGMIFGDVKIAANIWDNINFYSQISSGDRVPVANFTNGALQSPRVGDLIIYGEQYLTTGHVSVVVEMDASLGVIFVYEQNFENVYEHPHQKRSIRFINKNGRCWLLDNFIIGWKSPQEINN